LPNSGKKILQYFENYLEFFAVLKIMDYSKISVECWLEEKKTQTRTHAHNIFIYLFIYLFIYAVLMFAIKLFCNTPYIIRTSSAYT